VHSGAGEVPMLSAQRTHVPCSISLWDMINIDLLLLLLMLLGFGGGLSPPLVNAPSLSQFYVSFFLTCLINVVERLEINP
jgi:hypothetical protein